MGFGWTEVFSLITLMISGGLVTVVSIREKKRQEIEKTRQQEQKTKQDEITTSLEEFKYLKERTQFAEQHIPELHRKMIELQNKFEKRMVGMQNAINQLYARTAFAEKHICLRTDCKLREPALGTFVPQCSKKGIKVTESNDIQESNVIEDSVVGDIQDSGVSSIQ